MIERSLPLATVLATVLVTSLARADDAPPAITPLASSEAPLAAPSTRPPARQAAPAAHAAPIDDAATELRSPAAFTLGAVAISVGASAMTLGLAMWMGRACDETDPPTCHGPPVAASLSVLGAGAVVLAAGIPVLVYGNTRVPRRAASAASGAITVTPGAVAIVGRF